MKRMIGTGVAAVAAGVAALAAVAAWPIGKPPAEIMPEGDVQRGAYLARASGCIACHTNFEAGGPPLAGGAPLETDFGVFHPPNLTTDPDAGIGSWSIRDFARAVRQGISPDGEPYYPTFTYPFYASFSDQDIADLWAAFRTVAPVDEPTPEHEVAFPFDQRWGLKLWRAAYLRTPATAPKEGRSDAWNRGKELVRGAAHCGACHTDRNFAGARVLEAVLSGSDDLPGGGKAPSIRPDALRTEGWTVSSLAYALRTGITPAGDAFGGSMGEVVAQGTAFLSQADREAMAIYLLDNDLSGGVQVAAGD
ncbi:cytochrome c [Tranquillimonas alkanivorans]|uniref:Cytochrome c, mono-and diheme variants n=1 Tax=Tranquillimonas alkanivorans TaxID=441119 RepID=A0A1I5V5T3_9RHOB|nr:cytochrome c [Tranquillimonas alkanivorans]SFQ02296.1 Cytochrome c, mono-and diheme variants [Tranquillimonas alkanivorans]